jgi:hypothetical protein
MAFDAQVSQEHSEVGRPADAADTPGPPADVAPVWLQRLSLFVLVLFCVYLGVLVMVLADVGPEQFYPVAAGAGGALAYRRDAGTCVGARPDRYMDWGF